MPVDLFLLKSCSYDATLTAIGLNLKVKLHTKDMRLPLRNNNRKRLILNGNPHCKSRRTSLMEEAKGAKRESDGD